MTTGRINQVLSSNREKTSTHTQRMCTLPQPNPKTPFSFPTSYKETSSPISRGVVT